MVEANPNAARDGRSPSADTGLSGGLVGRRAELAILEAHAGQSVSGNGATIYLLGPSGIGKTRLLRQFLADRHREGWLAVTAECTPQAQAVPFLPVQVAINRLLRNPLEAPAPVRKIAIRLARRGLAAGRRIDGEPAAAAIVEMLERVIDALVLASRRSPVILAVDDLQWADDLTVHFVRRLAAQVHGERMLVLAAEPAPRAERSALTSAAAHVMELAPLSWTESRELLWKRSGGSDPPGVDLVTRLYHLSLGYPLFLEHAAAVLKSGGDPFAANGQAGIIGYHRDRLSPGVRDVLWAAANVGLTFSLEELVHALGATEETVLPELREAVQEGLIAETGDPERLAFTHPVIREVFADQRLLAERRRLHSRLLGWMVDRGTSASPATLAFHAEEAGEFALCARFAWLAGRAATHSGESHAAAEHYERALSAVDGPPDPAVLREAAAACVAAGRGARAAELYRSLSAGLEATGDSLAAAEATARMVRASVDEAGIQELHAAIERIEGSGETPELAYARATLVHATAGGLGRGGKALEAASAAALGLASRVGTQESLAVALLARGHLLANSLDFEQGCALLERSRGVAEESGANREQHAALVNLVLLRMKAAQWGAARAAAAAGARAAGARAAYRLAGQFVAKLAEIARIEGEWETAAEYVREALLLTDRGDLQSFDVARLAAATLAADLNEWDAVEEAAHAALGEGERMDQFFPGANWRDLLARALLAQGDLDGALRLGREIYGMWLTTSEAFYGSAYAESYVGMLCQARRFADAESVAASIERRLRWLPLPIRPVAEASWTMALAQIAQAAGRPSQAAVLARKALVTFTSAGMVHRSAMVERWLGQAPAQARAPGTGTPPLSTAARGAFTGSESLPALTAREAEIVDLVTRGLHSNEIGQRLFLSRRTVENHLARIYAKCDVHSRAALIARAIGG